VGADAVSSDYRILLAEYGQAHWWAAGMRRIGWALLGEVHGRLLDVGCGPGWMLAELPPGAWGVGIDQIRAAPHTALAVADACRMPFAAETFNLALALDLLEQRGVAPPVVLAELRRVLAAGGRLLIRVPAFPRLFGPHDRFWGGSCRYRKPELARLVSDAGFTVRRLTYANSLLFPAQAVVRILARLGLVGGDDLRPLPPSLNCLLLGMLSLEARWLRQHNLPMGLSLVCLAEREV
jgi:SAM-dependent methyltransferase